MPPKKSLKAFAALTGQLRPVHFLRKLYALPFAVPWLKREGDLK